MQKNIRDNIKVTFDLKSNLYEIAVNGMKLSNNNYGGHLWILSLKYSMTITLLPIHL